MSVPLFLDTDSIDDNIEFLRFVYWKLNIKEIDFDDLCSCDGQWKLEEYMRHDFNKIKLHIFMNQFVIKGIKKTSISTVDGEDEKYAFNQSGDFEQLFKTAFGYMPRYDRPYVFVDMGYVHIPFKLVPNPKPPGSVYRVHDEIFAGLLFSEEYMHRDMPDHNVIFQPIESKAYFEYMGRENFEI